MSSEGAAGRSATAGKCSRALRPRRRRDAAAARGEREGEGGAARPRALSSAFLRRGRARGGASFIARARARSARTITLVAPPESTAAAVAFPVAFATTLIGASMAEGREGEREGWGGGCGGGGGGGGGRRVARAARARSSSPSFPRRNPYQNARRPSGCAQSDVSGEPRRRARIRIGVLDRVTCAIEGRFDMNCCDVHIPICLLKP